MTAFDPFADSMFVTDGGLETTLVFHEGLDLPDFAAFPLLDDEEGRRTLERYYAAYLAIADRHGAGIVLDTPTWRANTDWGNRLGYVGEALDALNRRSVDFVRGLAPGRGGRQTLLNGVLGPRGDGYVADTAMSIDEAAAYHGPQIRAFADAGADLVTAVTMTYSNEGAGIAQAAAEAGIPAAISFTVETDGRLPSGEELGDAITTVDEATGSGPAYYMVNCAHPSHFVHVLDREAPWIGRIAAIRANASRKSHAELDEAEELDRGDPAELAQDYVALRDTLPNLRLVGGCCGTDHEHIAAVTGALLA